MKNILKIAAAAGIMFGGSAALAQTGNGSDVTGVTGGSIAGGSFTPLPTGGGGVSGGGGNVSGGSPSSGPAISNTAQSFSNGSSQTSSITNTVIPAAAVSQVGAVITSGSPASVLALGTALTNSGASPATVANLTAALAALANVTSSSAPGAIISAAQAYNALIASAPASFFTSSNGGPPPSILAIQAALAPMVASIGH